MDTPRNHACRKTSLDIIALQAAEAKLQVVLGIRVVESIQLKIQWKQVNRTFLRINSQPLSRFWRIKMHSKLRISLAMVILCYVASAVAVLAGDEPKSYKDHLLLRVEVETDEQLRQLNESGAVILDCYPGLGSMAVVASPKQLETIEKLNMRYEIRHRNMQELIDRQMPKSLRDDPFEDFFLDYHQYDNGTGSIVWYMNELVSRYPGQASMVNVGSTLEGNTIWGLRITNDAVAGSKPAVVFFGAEHAREWIASTVPSYVAIHLLESYGSDPAVTDLVDNIEFFLIPVMNVDGFDYTWTNDRLWRKNRRNNGDGSYGVDLNRNWAEGWATGGSSSTPSDITYHGPSPFSEPETQVMRDFFINHGNVRAQVDIHSYSQLMLWPYGYTDDLPVDQDTYYEVGMAMQSLTHAVHGITYEAGPIFSTIYQAGGGSLDWTYNNLDILSYCFELRPSEYDPDGFELPASEIIPNNEEILPALLYLSDTDWVRLPVRFRFPQELPADISAGTDTVINVEILDGYESVEPTTVRFFYRYDSAAPYTEQVLSDAGDGLYQAVLPATNCFAQPEYYFSVQTGLGLTVTSPGDIATETYMADVVNPAFFVENLDANPVGWTTEGLWAYGVPSGNGGAYGNPDPDSGYTGDNVFGYNLSGDYTNSLSQKHLTSPPVDCTGQEGVTLRFWRWLGVEQPQYDHASVSVSNNGSNWTTVWENAAEVTDSGWVKVELDISAVADNQPAVYLRWTMGTTDTGWTYCGWNIDDIALFGSGCDGAKGDYNGDRVVTIDDFAEFPTCVMGPENGVGPGCIVFDFDDDSDIDLNDFAAFQEVFYYAK